MAIHHDCEDSDMLHSHREGRMPGLPQEPITTASGETRYLYTRKIVLRVEAGEASHLLGMSLDITDRKHSVAELLKRADLAMYQAKAAGRNALRFFDSKL